MVILGSGGHTSEMLFAIRKIDLNAYAHIAFVSARTDKWSPVKLNDTFLKERGIKDFTSSDSRKLSFPKIYRSREVKQSYFTSIFTTLIATAHSLWILLRIQPDMIISNGPGTAVPLCYMSFILSKILMFNPGAKILFIESYCRVEHLSLSGKLLMPICDKFIVHWENLHKQYPKKTKLMRFIV